MWLQPFYNPNVNWRKFQVDVSLYFEFIFLTCQMFYYRLVIIKISPAAHMVAQNNNFIDVGPASNTAGGTI